MVFPNDAEKIPDTLVHILKNNNARYYQHHLQKIHLKTRNTPTILRSGLGLQLREDAFFANEYFIVNNEW